MRTSFVSTPRPERSTLFWRGQLIDQDGQGVPAASLTELTLTLIDTDTGAVINGVEAVNVLNTGRGTVDGEGNYEIRLGPPDTADTAIVTAGNSVEYRSAVLDWSYSNNLAGRHQMDFAVVALSDDV